MSKRTVALDFDGVLHPYTEGWVGPIPADEPPTSGSLEYVQQHADEYVFVVFSTRCDSPEGLKGTCAWLERWGFMPYIAEVTCTKPKAVAYVDDRAVPFVGSWDDVDAGVRQLAAGRPSGAPSQTAV
jgi:5'(3')-deoxyribonucleotidase